MTIQKINPDNLKRTYTDRINFTDKPAFLLIHEYLGKAKRDDWKYYDKIQAKTGIKPTHKQRMINLKKFDIGDGYSKVIISDNDSQRGLVWRTHKANRREWHKDVEQAKSKPKSKSIQKIAARAQANLDKTSNGPTICFGGRKLWHEAQTDTIKMEEFKNRRGFLGAIGRPDFYDPKKKQLHEYKTNEIIRVNEIGEVSILTPKGLRRQLGITKRSEYRIIIGTVYFNHGDNNIKEQLKLGRSITYHFDYKSGGHWHLRAQLQLPEVKNSNINAVNAMGVDVNDRHLDAAILSRDGNLIGKPFTLNFTNKRLDSTVDKLVSIAVKRGVRVVYIEKLSGLQRNCTRGRGGAINKTVNNIPTGKFKKLLTSKCEVYGIRVIEVEPAGTSSNTPDWFSVTRETDASYKHKTSAYLIGRRGLGYTIERTKVAKRRRLDSGRVYAMLHKSFHEVWLPGTSYSQASGMSDIPF